MANNRFKKGSGCFTCRCCGNKTRDTGHDNTHVELCVDCFDDAGYENEHSDDAHEATGLVAKCPYCQEHLAALANNDCHTNFLDSLGLN